MAWHGTVLYGTAHGGAEFGVKVVMCNTTCNAIQCHAASDPV